MTNKQPEALRLADELQKYPLPPPYIKLEAAALLRTQHALLEQAKDALETYQGFIDDAHILEGQWHWLEDAKNTIAALNQHLETK